MHVNKFIIVNKNLRQLLQILYIYYEEEILSKIEDLSDLVKCLKREVSALSTTSVSVVSDVNHRLHASYKVVEEKTFSEDLRLINVFFIHWSSGAPSMKEKLSS